MSQQTMSNLLLTEQFEKFNKPKDLGNPALGNPLDCELRNMPDRLMQV